MNSVSSAIRKPFIEHISELRKRLLWIVLVLAGFSCGAFVIHQHLLDIIQRPLGQTLYFTSPTGGLSFILQLCITVGIILGFPVIIYHLYQFISPLWHTTKKLGVFFYIFASFALACAGVLFAYFISLPAAISFLTQFGGENVQSLIKANEYFSFALAYLGGFALLFQIPLIISLINRITPLGPRKMLGSQKWVILISFAAAAIITPTPDPINQFILAAPAILLYQLSIVMIWLINKNRRQLNIASPNETLAYKQSVHDAPIGLVSAATTKSTARINDFMVLKNPKKSDRTAGAQRVVSPPAVRSGSAIISLGSAKSMDGILT